MESDLREAQTKRAMAETSAQKIAMIDHSKFGHVYVATSLLPEEIDLLIVDQSLSADQQLAVHAAQIRMELV